MRRRGGYILLEAVMSMAILSVTMVALQRGISETLFLRGQSRDYTQARFLLESLIAELELLPNGALIQGSQSGRFQLPEHNRFTWAFEISSVQLEPPLPPPDVPIEEVKELAVTYMAKLTVTVAWERKGVSFEESLQTLLPPERLFMPPSDAALAQPF